MTEQEELRYYEIKFHNLINNFFRKTNDPMRLYDFIDMLGITFNCNRTLLQAATMVAMTNSVAQRPKRYELVVLLTKTGMSVREICKTLRMSNPTYYKRLEEYKNYTYDIKPRYNPEHSKEIHKAIKGLQQLLNLLN